MAYDVTGKIIQYETEGLSHQQEAKLYRHLLKTGMIYRLPGAYQRRCQELIDNGTIRGNMKATPKQLVYAYLKDLVIDIRCARRDHCAANPLLGYAARCIAEFRALWNSRHCDSWDKLR